MSRKIDFDAAVDDAVKTGRSVGNRFHRAKEVLKDRPTGFVDAETMADENKGSQPAPLPAQAPTQAAASTDVSQSHVTAIDQLESSSGPVLMDVPIDLVDDNPFNARSLYNSEKVAALSKSLIVDGQLIPGLAAKKGDRFTLIAGHYRKKAAKQAGLKTLKLMVYGTLTDQQLYVYSYKENAEHNPQTVLDNAIAWGKLLADKVYATEVDLAESIGLSKANVNKTLSVMKLHKDVLEVIEEKPEKFGLSILYELYQLQQIAGSATATEFAHRVIEEEIGRNDILEARKSIQGAVNQVNTSGRRKNITSRRYEIRGGTIRDWDSGRVMVDITFDNEEEKIAFLESTRKNFGIQ